jgi:SAM-dependent methyltransferase
MSGTGPVMNKSIDFDEVADIYDDLDIGFFIEQFKGKKCGVLELMCGTGRVSIPLIQNGVDLTCVDYSPKMLGRFRGNQPLYDLYSGQKLKVVPFDCQREKSESQNQKIMTARLIKEILSLAGAGIAILTDKG